MSPIDQHFEEEDERSDHSGSRSKFGEFECPDCNANNPCDPPIEEGDEVICNYCGANYLVRVSESGKLKLKST